MDIKIPWSGKEHLVVEVRLTADGRWLHDGQEVTHARTVRAMHRGIEAWTAGGAWDWVVRIGGQAYPVVVDDTPWLARRARVEGSELILHLNTEEEVRMAVTPDVIWVDDDGVLGCQLPDGRRCRLLRTAQGDLVDRVVEGNGGAPALVVGERNIPLVSRTEKTLEKPGLDR